MEPLFMSATTYSPTHFRVQPGSQSRAFARDGVKVNRPGVA